MTPKDFTDWRSRLNLSKTAAAEALGISKNMPQRYENGTTDVPRHIALACSAIALNIPPYGSTSGRVGVSSDC